MMCIYKHLFSGQVHLSFQKSWQNGEGARKGKKFQPKCHILLGRLSDCIPTVMPLSRKAMPLCFQMPSSVQNLLTTLHKTLFTRQIFSIYTFSKCKLLLQFMLEGWGHGERIGWEEKSLWHSPAGPYQHFLSKKVYHIYQDDDHRPDSALLHHLDSTEYSVPLITFTPVEMTLPSSSPSC